MALRAAPELDRPAACIGAAADVPGQPHGRLGGVALMVGSALANVWDRLFTWQGAAVVALLFFVARPVSVQASLLGSSATRSQRLLTSWFGIRGVGSFYYLMYALEHAPRSAAEPRCSATWPIFRLPTSASL